MIRQDKVHIITCTGAILASYRLNLIAHDYYERVPNWRDLTKEDEQALLERHMNRATDTRIPEGEAMRRLEGALLAEWQRADKAGERLFPHEVIYNITRSGALDQYFQIDPANSWLLAACEKNLPIIVPGWEDSTSGNMYAAHNLLGNISNVHTVRTGIEYMMFLADWYTELAGNHSVGFFQIGGGIAGTSPSASCRCWNRTCSDRLRCGVTSARSATPPPVTARTQEQCRTRRSPGGNSAWTHPVS